MADLALDVAEWAAENFGTCELGDARRTRRAVKLAQQMAEHPDGSTPAQTERWADLQAAYRLVDGADVTCDAVAEPHWRQTRATAAGRVLLMGDTTETDFGIQRQLEGLGPTGDGAGRGFFRHRSLRVVPGTREIIGLAGQELFDRQPKPKGETDDQARQREQREQRESRVWGRVTDRVGAPADSVPYVHVFDRGANNIKVFCHAARQRLRRGDPRLEPASHRRGRDGRRIARTLVPPRRARPTTAAGNLLRRQVLSERASLTP